MAAILPGSADAARSAGDPQASQTALTRPIREKAPREKKMVVASCVVGGSPWRQSSPGDSNAGRRFPSHREQWLPGIHDLVAIPGADGLYSAQDLTP
jgi:hypothetical protein